MEIVWKVTEEDVANVKAFIYSHRDNPFVQTRIKTNLRDDKPPVSKDEFWNKMVGCLLSTQQRSGPSSPVSRFLTRPFALRHDVCAGEPDLAEFVRRTLTEFRGLRRANIIGKEVAANYAFLEQGGWKVVFENLNELRVRSSPTVERKVANFIDDHFRGFGPKQSRNLLQWLGLSRYEVPLDSRLTKWLNRFGFPIKLNSFCLSDRQYYGFVSDGFQHLCRACEVEPCVLDAAIFSSFDNGQWTEQNLIW